MKYLLHAQFRFIRSNPRLMFSLLICPAYMIGVNYFANAPWLTEDQLAAFLSAVIALLSGEVLYWITIDEIHSGTFEVLLLSEKGPHEIIWIKISLPTLIGFLLSFGSIILNNVLASYVSCNVIACSFKLVVFLFFVSALSCLLELISLLIARKQNINLHFYVMIAILALSIVVYEFISAQPLFLVAIVMLLLLSIPTICAYTLISLRYKVNYKKKRRLLFYRLFPSKRISRFSAMMRKDFSAVRDVKHFVAHIVVGEVVPIVAVYSLQGNILNIELIIGMMMSIISSACCLSIIYTSCLNDNKNNMLVLMKVNGISQLYVAVSKIVLTGTFACICGCIPILTILLAGATTNVVRLLVSTAVSNYIAAIISYVICRHIFSAKSEHIVKSLLSVVCIVIHLIIIMLF